ncbi:O-antigen ligase family protein [Methylobacter sp. S3L5C]|nr:O-antigen ligase family protein [Methylobacter sp. S3L5C]
MKPMTSWGLWVPLWWIIIIGSRPVSAWFGIGRLQPETPQGYIQGSPVDAFVYFLLIIIGFSVLIRRRLRWGMLLASNPWLFAFFLYCFISIIWSDYPIVASKRWIKDFGNVIMVLIVLSEKDHVQAIKAVFLRYSYLTVPLSVFFINYLPEFGRNINQWTWEYSYIGVTEDKNALGCLALISGLFLMWDFIEIRTKHSIEKNEVNKPFFAKQSSSLQQKKIIYVKGTNHRRPFVAKSTADTIMMTSLDLASHVLLLLMVFYLIAKADSSTSLVSLFIGMCIFFFIRRSFAKKQFLTRYLGTCCLILILLLLLLYSFPDILQSLFELLGEDMTLTGRTDLWADLLQSTINPFLGSGYQSFWLGSEATSLWEKYYFHPNQAHNGYLETYLNGGLIGLCLLIAVIISTGSKLKKEMLLGNSFGTLCFSFLVILVFSNWTEATFNRLSIQWVILILSSLNYSSLNDYIPINIARSRNNDFIRTGSNYEAKTPVKYGVNPKSKLNNKMKVNIQ